MKITKQDLGDKIITTMLHDNGEKDELVFSPKEGGRNRYLLNGKSVTGVTTILNKESKPQVTEWAIKLAYEDCLTKSKTQIEEVLANKDWASKRKSGSAMDIGTQAHAWVEEYAKAHIRGTAIPPLPEDKELHQILQPFVDWCNGRKPVAAKKNSYDKNSVSIAPMDHVKFIESEMTTVHKDFHYAGTFDMLIEIDGKKYMADFKTSSGIYGRSYFAQCAAYAKAWQRMGYDMDIAGSVIIRSGKAGNDLEVVSSYTFDKDFMYFLSCLGIYKMGELDATPEDLGL